MSKKLDNLLAHSAATHPEKIAIEMIDCQTITYRDLNCQSDRHRNILSKYGIKEGDRVGIYAQKSIKTVVSIFGILKSGAAYVPVDAGAPPERNAYIFKDCGVKAIFAETRYLQGLKEAYGIDDVEILADLGDDVCYAAIPESKDQIDDHRTPEALHTGTNLAYILYTSGSTGKPKGVMHTHASALSFVDWCSETLEPNESDRFSSHAPFHFDLSILDIYVAIKHGAALVLIDDELGKQPLRLAPFIADSKISVWYSTPSVLQLLAQFGKMPRHDYSNLRIVIFAGEVFALKHLRTLKTLWPQPRYFNLYGPTETNVCTYYKLPKTIPAARMEPFPIGKICSNDSGTVTDEDGNEVLSGCEGELYVRGGSVMSGYWHMPERTQEAFYRDDNGISWYKTGDIVREDENGDYVFVGRRDRMVKRRGFRVELGEIEAGLYRHPNVMEAAVVALPDEESGVKIKAFLCCSEEPQPSLIQMKGFCSRNLPAYMIPDTFLFMPALPKTSTDKIDYQKLLQIH